jgi:hypothetical protein
MLSTPCLHSCLMHQCQTHCTAAHASLQMSTVSVNAKLRVTCLPLGQGGQPQQQHQQVLTKQGAWLFVRGPLPRGFSSQLALPWRVLGWWG